jgi:hypothetical protein
VNWMRRWLDGNVPIAQLGAHEPDEMKRLCGKPIREGEPAILSRMARYMECRDKERAEGCYL